MLRISIPSCLDNVEYTEDYRDRLGGFQSNSLQKVVTELSTNWALVGHRSSGLLVSNVDLEDL